jgi:hypothetical protein
MPLMYWVAAKTGVPSIAKKTVTQIKTKALSRFIILIFL